MRAFTALLLAPCLLAQTPPRGPWMGQTLPEGQARLFAPGFVSTGMYTRDFAMTPDGREAYFAVVLGGYQYAKILVTRQGEDGTWSEPQVAPFCAPGAMDLEPHISPDGKRFFFLSRRPDPADPAREVSSDIWVMDRTPTGWSAPRNLGAPVNTPHDETFPSMALDGTLYFARREKNSRDEIYCARPDGKGGFLAPEKLPPQVNAGRARFNACISADGTCLVVPTFGRPDTTGSTDYYACFRKPDGTWTEGVNLGRAVNTPFGEEYSPFLSADGKALVFMSVRPRPAGEAFGTARTYRRIQELHREPGAMNPAIYWISAAFLPALQPR